MSDFGDGAIETRLSGVAGNIEGGEQYEAAMDLRNMGFSKDELAASSAAKGRIRSTCFINEGSTSRGRIELSRTKNFSGQPR